MNAPPRKREELLFWLRAKEGLEREVLWTSPALLEIHRQKRVPFPQRTANLIILILLVRVDVRLNRCQRLVVVVY
jgi:hypothetical protein